MSSWICCFQVKKTDLKSLKYLKDIDQIKKIKTILELPNHKSTISQKLIQPFKVRNYRDLVICLPSSQKNINSLEFYLIMLMKEILPSNNKNKGKF